MVFLPDIETRRNWRHVISNPKAIGSVISNPTVIVKITVWHIAAWNIPFLTNTAAMDK